MVVPFTGAYLVLYFQKAQVKKEIKRKMIAGMDKNELVLLKFTKKSKIEDLKWKHTKEFEYNGEMYDVVEVKQISDTIFYWCWIDYEETKLNIKLQNLVAYALGHNPNENKRQKLIESFFKLQFYSSNNNLFNFCNTVFPEQFAFVKIPSYVDTIIAPSNPPPQKNN